MKNRWMHWLAAAIGGVLVAAPAFALPYRDGSEVAIQRIIDAQEGFGGVTADESKAGKDLAPTFDDEAVFTIVAEGANFRDRNVFGIYSGSRMIDLFEGSAGVNATRAVDLPQIKTELGSNTFGFYLKSPQGWFFSDPVKNSDGIDHMVAYVGERDLLIGFEDLNGGGDRDYEDFVVRVSPSGTGPVPVPEPATLLLLGSGILGLAFARKSRS